MKDIGKVKDYNNFYGTIVNEKGDKYILLKSQLYKENEDIKKSDLVSFVPEEYDKNKVKIKIARFIRKITKR